MSRYVMAKIVDILLPLALEGAFSYRVPEEMTLAPGDYVEAPFGARHAVGVVWGERETAPPGVTLKTVSYRFDLPPMAETHRRFLTRAAAYYLEPPGQFLRLSLRSPGAFAALREDTAYRATGHVPAKLTVQRQRVLDAMRDAAPMRLTELCLEAGVSGGVVKGLLALGALEEVKRPAERPFAIPDPALGGHDLSAEQAAAAADLRAGIAVPGARTVLLDGVTGSGKTEVYFEAMAATLATGAQVLLLLPEIALTAQFLARVERRFGVEPAHWHSEVKPRERERVWRGVAAAEARIVVGARSALFLPWANLGLIVVDEEHEGAYKQDEGVSYHARDLAVLYGSIGKFPVVLSSATPSLESLVNVDRGRYAMLKLSSRHGLAEMPETTLIDMRQAKLEPGSWISPALDEAVRATLTSGDQALLFLNRRGYAPLTLCRACGHRMQCPNCAAAMVEHRFRRQLLCHHCGQADPIPHVCPGCAREGQLVVCGPGIERLADEVKRRYPEARTAVLSSDLMRGAALREALSEIEAGRINLIVGTQLIAKGHHFPHLTLAGVIDADLALETGDPRGGERTWQTMAQVAGRAGRGAKPGRALVQTYLPDHALMQALQRGDRDGYLAQEKKIREEAGLPPFGLLAALIVSGGDQAETERFAQYIARAAPIADDLRVLGPAPAPLHLLRGRHRWRLLVKCSRPVDMQAYLRTWLHGIQPKGSLRLAVDIDPYSFM